MTEFADFVTSQSFTSCCATSRIIGIPNPTEQIADNVPQIGLAAIQLSIQLGRNSVLPPLGICQIAYACGLLELLSPVEVLTQLKGDREKDVVLALVVSQGRCRVFRHSYPPWDTPSV